MTRRDVLECSHEPFGDAFYFGPEFLSDRYRDDPEARQASATGNKTYKDVLDEFAQIENEVREFLSSSCP
jgi:hypothetical protein